MNAVIVRNELIMSKAIKKSKSNIPVSGESGNLQSLQLVQATSYDDIELVMLAPSLYLVS